MTSEITDAMVEAGLRGWADSLINAPNEDVGARRRRCIHDIIAAALAARPAPEAGSDDLITDLRKAAFTEPEPGRHSLHLAAIEKIERLERERDDARKNALENGMELCRQRSRAERLWKAIDDALGRHQITHIHAGLRAALQQEGESDV